MDLEAHLVACEADEAAGRDDPCGVVRPPTISTWRCQAGRRGVVQHRAVLQRPAVALESVQAGDLGLAQQQPLPGRIPGHRPEFGTARAGVRGACGRPRPPRPASTQRYSEVPEAPMARRSPKTASPTTSNRTRRSLAGRARGRPELQARFVDPGERVVTRRERPALAAGGEERRRASLAGRSGSDEPPPPRSGRPRRHAPSGRAR